MGNIKRWGWEITSVILLATLFAVPVHADIVLGEQITNGGFDSGLTGWSTTGTAQARLATDVINTSVGNAGFNTFFTSRFAAVGDTTGNIQFDPYANTHGISQTITLASVIGGNTISSYNLIISFNTAFDGRDSTLTSHDTFTATFNSLPLFTQDSSGFPESSISTANANNQLVNNPGTFLINNLLPGTYTLSFMLNEASDSEPQPFTNTAAGIDMVSVTGTANTVPEPSTMLLLGSGLAGLVGYGRKRLKR